MVIMSLVALFIWLMAGLTITLVIAAVQGHWYKEPPFALKFMWDVLTWPMVTLAMVLQALGRWGYFSPERFEG